MTFTLHRIAPFIASASASAVPAKSKGGRPRGSQPQRKPIPLPDGDVLTPLFSTFAESVGLSAKALQRMRHRLPTVDIAGVAYVRDRAARAILAAPAKPRRGRLR